MRTVKEIKEELEECGLSTSERKRLLFGELARAGKEDKARAEEKFQNTYFLEVQANLLESIESCEHPIVIKATELGLRIYDEQGLKGVDIYDKRPDTEMYSQLFRSLHSVASTFPERAGRHSVKDKIKFLSYTLGSINEAVTQTRFTRNPDYIKCAESLQKDVHDFAAQFMDTIIGV